MVDDDEGGGQVDFLIPKSCHKKRVFQSLRTVTRALVIYKPHLIESHSNVSSFRMQFDLRLRRDIYAYYRFLC